SSDIWPPKLGIAPWPLAIRSMMTSRVRLGLSSVGPTAPDEPASASAWQALHDQLWNISRAASASTVEASWALALEAKPAPPATSPPASAIAAIAGVMNLRLVAALVTVDSLQSLIMSKIPNSPALLLP